MFQSGQKQPKTARNRRKQQKTGKTAIYPRLYGIRFKKLARADEVQYGQVSASQ